MHQLTKNEILALPAGLWRGYLGLYHIMENELPRCFIHTRWNVEVEVLPPNNKYLKLANGISWAQYNVQLDCANMGDLVFETKLMRMFKDS